jgi:hypothetical protein
VFSTSSIPLRPSVNAGVEVTPGWVKTKPALTHRHDEIGLRDPKSGCGPRDLAGQTHRVAVKAPDGRLQQVRAAADDDVQCRDDEEEGVGVGFDSHDSGNRSPGPASGERLLPSRVLTSFGTETWPSADELQALCASDPISLPEEGSPPRGVAELPRMGSFPTEVDQSAAA